MEVSPPGGILLRKAPGTAAFDFGQFIPLTTLWQQQHLQQPQQPQRSPPPVLPASPATAAAGARRRTTMQHHGGCSGGLSVHPSSGTPPGASDAAGGVALWDESTAWVCNFQDPLLAAEYLQR